MTIFYQFSLHLQESLLPTQHLTFEHFLMERLHIGHPIHILWKEENSSVISSIRKFPDLRGIVISQKEKDTSLRVTFKDGSDCQLNFITELAFQKKTFLDANVVLEKRQLSTSGKYMPNIEHLFEFGVLSHFLNNRGISEAYQSYFDGFHFFVQEGLLEFLNDKYQTSFKTFDELAVFNPKEKLRMMEAIGKMPANQFLNQMNVRWHNFLGHLRQARF